MFERTMTPEEFYQMCQDISMGSPTGRMGAEKTFFTAVALAISAPNWRPPSNDEEARKGYMLGKELKKKIDK